MTLHRAGVRYLLLATKDAQPSPAADAAPVDDPATDPTGPTSDAGSQWAGDPFDDTTKISDPDKAFASFSDDHGNTAWLDQASDRTLTGWVTDSTGQTYRYSDVDAWAVDVDDSGMKRTGGTGPETDGEDPSDGGAADTTEPGSATSKDVTGVENDQMSLLNEGKTLVLSVKHMGGDHDQSVHGTRAAGRNGMHQRSEAGRLPRRRHQIVATDAHGTALGSENFKAAAAPPGAKTAPAPAGAAHTAAREYADEGWQADGQKRYPTDSPEHVRAGIRYLARKRNADRYSPEHLAKVKANLRKAAKKHGIDAAI